MTYLLFLRVALAVYQHFWYSAVLKVWFRVDFPFPCFFKYDLGKIFSELLNYSSTIILKSPPWPGAFIDKPSVIYKAFVRTHGQSASTAEPETPESTLEGGRPANEIEVFLLHSESLQMRVWASCRSPLPFSFPFLFLISAKQFRGVCLKCKPEMPWCSDSKES